MSDLAQLWKLPLALTAAPFYRRSHPHLWLVSEAPSSAHDNGYWFFKYLRTHHPEQECVYVISADSPELAKVQALGSTVAYGSLKHWVMYLAAEKRASNQKAGNPNAAIFYALEVSGLLRTKRLFLQHGITKDDMPWLYFDQTKFSGFICGAEPEYKYVQECFGYPENAVFYTGFCRFDALHDETATHSRQVLIMPTWREWIADEDGRMATIEGTNDITKTEYFLAWNEFLRSPCLAELAEKYGVTFTCYPHHEMQKYLHLFPASNSYLEVLSSTKADVQELLKTSAMLITDYSSVFFDMAYMKKPTFFYQFDEAKFRKGQYKQGYFDYHRTAFGSWHGSLDSLLDALELALSGGLKVDAAFENEHAKYFPLYDTSNCERVYQAMKEM